MSTTAIQLSPIAAWVITSIIATLWSVTFYYFKRADRQRDNINKDLSSAIKDLSTTMSDLKVTIASLKTDSEIRSAMCNERHDRINKQLDMFEELIHNK